LIAGIERLNLQHQKNSQTQQDEIVRLNQALSRQFAALKDQEAYLVSYRDQIDILTKNLEKLEREYQSLAEETDALQDETETTISRQRSYIEQLSAELNEAQNHYQELAREYQKQSTVLKQREALLSHQSGMSSSKDFEHPSIFAKQEHRVAIIKGGDKSSTEDAIVYAYLEAPVIEGETNEEKLTSMVKYINPPPVKLPPEKTTLYSASGQAYDFSYRNKIAEAKLYQHKTTQATEFDNQKLCLTVMNMLENIIVHHDVVELSTDDAKIKQYVKDYLYCLNTYAFPEKPIQLIINGKDVSLEPLKTGEYPYSDPFKKIWNDGRASRVTQGLLAIESDWYKAICQRMGINPVRDLSSHYAT
jgi:hypothetical protein